MEATEVNPNVNVSPATENDGPAVNDGSEEDDDPKDRKTIVFTVPLELWQKVATKADDDDTSVPGWIRQLVADEFDYVLPSMTIRRKYATEEERKEAQKEAAAKRNKLAASLIRAMREGKIDLASLGIDLD